MPFLLLTSRSSYQMSAAAEPWVVGPSFCPLDLVERIISILELRYEL